MGTLSRSGTTALVALIAGVASRAGAQAPIIPALDSFACELVHRAPPLALSVVVIRGDSIIHLSGYGFRDVRQKLPVTTETAFYIASSTKSFTALTAALLAERGVVDLDVPIRAYAPEFSLPAPLDPERITLRRLLSHRAGFESPPVALRTAFVGDVPPDSLFTLLSRTATPVDTTFTYTNTAFIVAARVLERATGVPWQRLIAREILTPLGLRRTTTIASAARKWETAAGFGPGPAGYAPTPAKQDATMHAAGGMLMSASDAAMWLLAQVNDGVVRGRRRLPARPIQVTHHPLATQHDTIEGIQRSGYGLGWQIGILDGDTIYYHFGNYPGAFAHVSFIPSRRIGVAVFANTEMPAFGSVTLALARRAYDLAAGRHERDAFYGSYSDSLERRVKRMYEFFAMDARTRAARPSLPRRGWGPYVGTYEAPDLGRVSIVVHGDSAAELLYGVSRSKLEVFSGDTLRVELPVGRSGSPLPVEFNESGVVERLTLTGAVFRRVVP